ncbi:hypothetical protein [Variovorax gossypii]
MNDSSKAMRDARSSRMVQRYRDEVPIGNARLFNEDFWENVFNHAVKPAHLKQVREFLDGIENDGMYVFPSVLYNAKKARAYVAATEKKMAEAKMFRRRK